MCWEDFPINCNHKEMPNGFPFSVSLLPPFILTDKVFFGLDYPDKSIDSKSVAG